MKAEAGWEWPASSRKAHYFLEGEMRSLCGGWVRLSSNNPEDDNHDSADNCARCRRKREKLS